MTDWILTDRIVKKWKEKKFPEISSFYTCVAKTTIIWDMVPEIGSQTDRTFCYFGLFFALLPQYCPQKLKFGKNAKNAKRFYPFKLVYHKWRSYDVRFLRHGAWQTEFQVILGHFFLYTPLPTEKSKFWKKKKKQKNLEIPSFYTCVPPMTIIWCMVEIRITKNIIFCNFGLYFALLPHSDQENQNFEKISIPSSILTIVWYK